jgi:hypothetical protein
MGNKKKQHFVSQFLLRNFSLQRNSKLINLYNHKTDQIIERAGIKTQAQENNYYGVDKAFEDFLAVTEDRASPLIRNILDTHILPGYLDKSYSHLLHFIMLYAFRTKASVDHTEEYLNNMLRELSKYDKRLQEIDFDKYRLKHPEPAAYNLAYYMDNWVITYDLNCVLLVNKTENDFFISDNPFVQLNPFMLKKNQHASAEGLLNKGLMLLFPLSPSHYLMFYDSWAYNIIGDKHTLELSKVEDVDYINSLQAIFSDRIIYYSDSVVPSYIKEVVKKALIEKIDQTRHSELTHPIDRTKKILMSYHIKHEFCPEFSFIRETSSAIGYVFDGKSDHTRNQEIVDWVKMDKRKLYGRK